jgi:hypothetical protein
MSSEVMSAGLLAAGFGLFLKWLIIRRWARVYLHPQTAIFPKLCPVCLSLNADATIDEESGTRETANYVVAHKLEWWKAAVPHCSECNQKLVRNQVTGYCLGAACIVTAFVLTMPSSLSWLSVCYILFGFPAYLFATTIQKGVVLGSANSTTMRVHVRRSEYFDVLAALNGIRSAATAVPLPDNKGVWQRRE